MTFEEIFNNDGMYVADSFRQGIAFEVIDSVLYIVKYNSPEQLCPQKSRASCYKGLFEKDYREVLLVNELFK